MYVNHIQIDGQCALRHRSDHYSFCKTLIRHIVVQNRGIVLEASARLSSIDTHTALIHTGRGRGRAQRGRLGVSISTQQAQGSGGGQDRGSQPSQRDRLPRLPLPAHAPQHPFLPSPPLLPTPAPSPTTHVGVLTRVDRLTAPNTKQHTSSPAESHHAAPLWLGLPMCRWVRGLGVCVGRGQAGGLQAK